MKKITILVITILALGFMLSSCQFVAGLLPTIGGTIWSYSTTIDGVGTVSGTLYYGKRTNSFSTLDGTITPQSPAASEIQFTGHADRYKLTINTINLGGGNAIRFVGEVDNHTHSTMLSNSIIYYTTNYGAANETWKDGVWKGTMLDK